tara:strand:- start:6171 stop:7367 length:1197 start_codon:yes stop_codon:yes gene_type:complete
MKHLSLTLYLEINNTNFIFFVRSNDDQNNFKTIYELKTKLEGITDDRISDIDKISDVIKENIYAIEKKLNYTFKEIIVILENFNPQFINFSGYKKLNGSQILRENITYILNTLKSCVSEIELKKTILHIFNSKFILDKKKIENLPIGLFGDFYSHELSFALINYNDDKNLNLIINKCNLKLKKIFLKSFIKGTRLSDDYKNIDTFFYIQIKDNNSKIFYFENDSLKSEQNFRFGTDIIIKDISKITSLKIDTVKKILEETEFKEDFSDDNYVEEEFFIGENYRKIKKKLIYEVAQARIEEILDIIIFKNINYCYYSTISKQIFFEKNSKQQLKFIEKIYGRIFSNNSKFTVNYVDNASSDNILDSSDKLVHFGWKKEAIPITQTNKSIVARIFDTIFG